MNPAYFGARLGLLLIFTLAIPHAVSADEPSLRVNIAEFIEQNCIDCHSADTQEGELNLADLEFNPADHSNLRRWVMVFDRVHAREMPPPDTWEPDAAQRQEFLAAISAPMSATLQDEYKRLGRVRLRRLNRIEYENTMHDLLGIDIPLRDFLPEDTHQDNFATVANAQQVSHHLMQKYLDAADASLDKAFSSALQTRRKLFHHQYSSAELGRKSGQRDPWHVGKKTIAWSATQVYHGRIPETEIQETGWYRITLHDAHAVNVKPGQGAWCTVRTGVGFARAPIMYLAGFFRADREPRDQSFEAWMTKGHLVEARPTDSTIPKVNGTKLNSYKGSKRDKRPMPKVPGLAYSAITIEAIRKAPPHDEVARRLFSDQSIDEASPREEIARLLKAFATRAFRHPVSDEQLKPYLTLADDDLKSGLDLYETLKRSYRTVLCSPHFLFLQERPGPLSDHAIACRLSYFLWSTMPDEKLMAAADAGKLTSPRVRRKQVERMLSDPRAERLTDALADQWLNLREIEFTSPDAGLYPEFDEPLQYSMVAETHAFLTKLIAEDLPTTNIIDSDFAMLNERLAKHYGIPDIDFKDIQPVALKPEYHRGGLITQGALLKVTANGTTTSPVVRGAFINERILGLEIPPPPDNIPAIEPDIRGAISIRDQLSKHSSDASCAACHIKIDPPGFALENYDVIGGWRTNYRKLKSKSEKKSGDFKPGIPVDAHHQMATGETFDDIQQFKQIVLKNPEQIARNFTHQLITYATGAPVSFSDRTAIEDILNSTQPTQYGARSIVHAVVDSPVFLTK